MNQPDDLDVHSLAVQERFLEEWNAGKRPRLGEYVRRYPAYAAALTALVATLPPDSTTPSAAEVDAPLATAPRVWSGVGVSRALDTIFGAHRSATDATGAQSLRVAEDRASYSINHPADETPESDV